VSIKNLCGEEKRRDEEERGYGKERAHNY